jgi:hypothetical protein
MSRPNSLDFASFDLLGDGMGRFAHYCDSIFDCGVERVDDCENEAAIPLTFSTGACARSDTSGQT